MNIQASSLKNLELEEEDKRREKRKQLLNAATSNQKMNDGPLSPNSSGAMEALFEKLKQAGPAQREKREIRRKAYLKGGRRTASGASRTASGASIAESVGEQPVSSSDATSAPSPLPSIPSSAAEEEDALTSKTQEMLMRLRGETSGDLGSQGGSLRVRRRRGSGEDLRRERRRRQGSNVSSTTAPLPPDNEDPDAAVAKAKMVLMGMRRGSEADEDAISGGLPTPTTIISPPSPEPGKSVNA
jgi:cytokinesis protein